MTISTSSRFVVVAGSSCVALSSLARQRYTTTFGLLRAVLKRALVVPGTSLQTMSPRRAIASNRSSADIYALLANVARIAVRSDAPPLRAQCRSLFADFLLHYPMSDDALMRHLAFVLKNMRSYEVSGGRQSCIEVRLCFCLSLDCLKMSTLRCSC